MLSVTIAIQSDTLMHFNSHLWICAAASKAIKRTQMSSSKMHTSSSFSLSHHQKQKWKKKKNWTKIEWNKSKIYFYLWSTITWQWERLWLQLQSSDGISKEWSSVDAVLAYLWGTFFPMANNYPIFIDHLIQLAKLNRLSGMLEEIECEQIQAIWARYIVANGFFAWHSQTLTPIPRTPNANLFRLLSI